MEDDWDYWLGQFCEQHRDINTKIEFDLWPSNKENPFEDEPPFYALTSTDRSLPSNRRAIASGNRLFAPLLSTSRKGQRKESLPRISKRITFKPQKLCIEIADSVYNTKALQSRQPMFIYPKLGLDLREPNANNLDEPIFEKFPQKTEFEPGIFWDHRIPPCTQAHEGSIGIVVAIRNPLNCLTFAPAPFPGYNITREFKRKSTRGPQFPAYNKYRHFVDIPQRGPHSAYKPDRFLPTIQFFRSDIALDFRASSKSFIWPSYKRPKEIKDEDLLALGAGAMGLSVPAILDGDALGLGSVTEADGRPAELSISIKGQIMINRGALNCGQLLECLSKHPCVSVMERDWPRGTNFPIILFGPRQGALLLPTDEQFTTNIPESIPDVVKEVAIILVDTSQPATRTLIKKISAFATRTGSTGTKLCIYADYDEFLSKNMASSHTETMLTEEETSVKLPISPIELIIKFSMKGF